MEWTEAWATGIERFATAGTVTKNSVLFDNVTVVVPNRELVPRMEVI